MTSHESGPCEFQNAEVVGVLGHLSFVDPSETRLIRSLHSTHGTRRLDTFECDDTVWMQRFAVLFLVFAVVIAAAWAIASLELVQWRPIVEVLTR